MPSFELWSVASGNLLAEFATPQELMEALIKAAERNGIDHLKGLGLIVEPDELLNGPPADMKDALKDG